MPEIEKKWGCVCQGCIAPGDPALMRRVRAAIARSMNEARLAKNDDDIAHALSGLDTPLERAKGRVDAMKILSYKDSASAKVRTVVASLLWRFRSPEASKALHDLIRDKDEDVACEAMESLLRLRGAFYVSGLMNDVSEEVRATFIEALEFEENALEILQSMQGRQSLE